MASTLSGPIPAHPMFSNGLNNSSPRVAPRVKPEASSFALHGKNGTIANLFEITGTNCLSASRPRKESKDYVSENVRKMRQIQRKCKQKQKEIENTAPVPVKALWKSEKYEDVPSKLAEILNKSNEAPRPRSSSFLKAHSKTGIPATPPRPQSSRTPRNISKEDEKSPPVEKLDGLRSRSASCSDISALGTSVNFIKVNALAASRQYVKRPPSQVSLEETVLNKEQRYATYKQNVLGSVPKYLQKRKEDWEKQEEERIRNLPDPETPAGHKLMPNEERLETLDLLQKSHKELSSKLSALPIRSDTMRVRSAKEQLENKLNEVEEAIKIFSRSKVFVKLDE